MSVKHIKSYYEQICDQYKEMIENLHSIEQEAEVGLIEPERVERLKDQIDPIKKNYERWSYMMFLLNQPNRKNKRRAYQKQNQKLLNLLSASNSPESVLEENRTALENIGK